MAAKVKELVKGVNGHSENSAAKPTRNVVITEPNMQTAVFTIEGTAPYVQLRFSEKAKQGLHGTFSEDKPGNKKKNRSARNWDEDFQCALYASHDGWRGIPASAFRNGMVSACRVVGFMMTRAKLAVFVEADGFDGDEGIPLVRITRGDPEYSEMIVRNANGQPDLRVRGMWREGWQATLRVVFDADMFSTKDIANLLARVGTQVGIGEGRPDSKNSTGMGWGTFRLVKIGETKE